MSEKQQPPNPLGRPPIHGYGVAMVTIQCAVKPEHREHIRDHGDGLVSQGLRWIVEEWFAGRAATPDE